MPRRNGHNENRFGHDFLLPALVSFSCLRQIRIMSKSSGRENLVSFASGSPASAFIGRNTVRLIYAGADAQKIAVLVPRSWNRWCQSHSQFHHLA